MNHEQKTELLSIVGRIEQGPADRLVPDLQAMLLVIPLSMSCQTVGMVFDAIEPPDWFGWWRKRRKKNKDFRQIRVEDRTIDLEQLAERLTDYTLQGGVDEGFELFKRLNTLLADHPGWQVCASELGDFFRDARRLESRFFDQQALDKPKESAAAEVVRRMAPQIDQKNHWFAVWRALHDSGAELAGTMATFVEAVHLLLPDHPKLPSVRTLKDMEAGCFTRRIDEWTEAKAPIQGARYRNFRTIADDTLQLYDDLQRLNADDSPTP